MTGGDHWFVQKRYGYGATPANWKGWAATATFVALEILLAVLLLLLPARSGGIGTGDIVVYVLTTGLLVAGFLWLAHGKTRGGWRWRWGSRGQGGRE